MNNRTIKISVLILLFTTLITSCDFSVSTASVEDPDSQTEYDQSDSDYWSNMFEDYWNYMNVNYVFWDMEENKDGEYQDNQEKTDWDEIYSTYSLSFKVLEYEDDLPKRNLEALIDFQTLIGTLIDHHYYMYFKDVLIYDESIDSPNSYNLSLATPGKAEVTSRDYYDENYYLLNFSEYNYNNFKGFDTDGITTVSLGDENISTPTIIDDIYYTTANHKSDFYQEKTIELTTFLQIIEHGFVEANGESNENTITLEDKCNLPESISSNLSNVKVFDTSNHTDDDDDPLVIISALFDSDGDNIGDTPYIYLSNFYCTGYAYDKNVTDIIDNFWALVNNTNETGKVKKIIFDLRHNSGGYLADLSDVVAPLINEDENKAYSYTRYKAGDNRTDYTPLIENSITGTSTVTEELLIDFPIIILADIISASMSEITIMALKEIGGDNTIVMGQRTWGGTGPLIKSIFLDGTEENDYYYVYTSANTTFDLEGKTYEGIGITPDNNSGISTIAYTDADGWGNDTLLEIAVLYGVD